MNARNVAQGYDIISFLLPFACSHPMHPDYSINFIFNRMISIQINAMRRNAIHSKTKVEKLWIFDLMRFSWNTFTFISVLTVHCDCVMHSKSEFRSLSLTLTTHVASVNMSEHLSPPVHPRDVVSEKFAKWFNSTEVGVDCHSIVIFYYSSHTHSHADAH